MRYAIALALFFCLCVPSAFNQAASTQAQQSTAATGVQGDTSAIEAIEADLLKSEASTNIAFMERTLADDYVNLLPSAPGPGKKEIIEGMKPHAGQAPPYSVEMHDLHVYLLGDTAVAVFVKTYTGKENGNMANEDLTHVFARDHGIWKLKISRASGCQMN
jgi:ketosteroid isomerase-like protein